MTSQTATFEIKGKKHQILIRSEDGDCDFFFFLSDILPKLLKGE